MSRLNDKEIEELLNKWWKAKNALKDYQTRCDKYKNIVEKIMKAKQTTKLNTRGHMVTRREMRKRQILKSVVPKDLWDKYATENTYYAYFLTER